MNPGGTRRWPWTAVVFIGPVTVCIEQTLQESDILARDLVDNHSKDKELAE